MVQGTSTQQAFHPPHTCLSHCGATEGENSNSVSGNLLQPLARKLPGTQHGTRERKPVPGLPSITATLYYQNLYRQSPLPEVSRTRVDRSRREPGYDGDGEGSQGSPRAREGLRRDPAPTLPSDLGSPHVAETILCFPSSQDSPTCFRTGGGRQGVTHARQALYY